MSAKKKARAPSRTVKKNARPPNTTLNRLKKNWATWALSVIMALSLLGRCAGPTARRAAQASRVTPTPTVVATPVVETDGELITGQLTFQDSPNPVKTYEYQFTVPQSWRGKYETQTNGSLVSFIYDPSPDVKVPLFTVTAYSEGQWQQRQSEPSYHGEKLLAQDGVVFADDIVLNRSSAGSQVEELRQVAADIPQVIRSFKVR